MLQDMLRSIHPSDKSAYAACTRRFDSIAKPVGSLGKLEQLISSIGAITGTTDICIRKKCVLVFCADNGVTAQGVTQCDTSVTTAIAGMMANKTSSVCTMAAAAGADVIPIDIGMRDTVEGLIGHKLMAGTDDISQGPAMTRECAEKAILTGITLVKEQKEAGYHIIATGEAGIGNTTTTAAMASLLLNLPASKTAGRGAGLSDTGLVHKRTVIERAIAINRPDPADPIDILHKLGGLDIAAMTGVFLGGAIYRIPIVMDGVISSAAALTAVRICPYVKDYILPSHLSAEPVGRLIINELGVSPILHGDMRLGEGTGAVTIFPLLDMAAEVYNHSATFEQISVEAYKQYP